MVIMKNILSPACMLLSCTMLFAANSLNAETIAQITVDTNTGSIEINDGEIKIDGRNIKDMNTNSSQSSQSSSTTSSSSNSTQRSVNTVYLSSHKLSEPHLLKLATTGNDLSGNMVLDGKTIKEINSEDFELDLAPYLSPGTHKLIITVKSMSPDNSVSLQLNAPGNSFNHNTSGNGTMEHVLNLNVR